MKKQFLSVIAAALCLSPLVAHSANAKTTVEYAKFTLKEGVTDTQMIAASQKFEEGFLVKQSGYIKRDLLHIKGREWADIVYWASREEAEKVLKACEKSPVCGEYFSIMEPFDPKIPNGGVIHLEVVKSYSISGGK
ncbi:MAG: hypothetical protein ACK500_02530 [Flavobacteriales bacterium]